MPRPSFGFMGLGLLLFFSFEDVVVVVLIFPLTLGIITKIGWHSPPYKAIKKVMERKVLT